MASPTYPQAPSQPRFLFLLKKRDLPYAEAVSSDPAPYGGLKSSGLTNSATFVVDMLVKSGIEAKLVEVVDNNCIDREVSLYHPTHVVIEALWVVPEKFTVLTALHPSVQWIVRIHSELTFIANESIAIDWIMKYVTYPNVIVAPNSERTVRDLRKILAGVEGEEQVRRVVYLPNVYEFRSPARPIPHHGLNIGCFGAVRPMKNQLVQAVAAIHYADETGQKLQFHMNGTRPEQGGGQAMQNIRALFNHSYHELVEHPWFEHDQFLRLLDQMDCVAAVSLSETFCIVAADAVSMNVPIVVSPEVRWASPFSKAKTTSAESIVRAMYRVLGPGRGILKAHNRYLLNQYTAEAREEWLSFINQFERSQLPHASCQPGW